MVSARSSDRIILGIDFGTTFSGVAFTYRGGNNSSNEVGVLTNWPGKSNLTSDKVPTEITYEDTQTGQIDSATPRAFRWGYMIEPQEQRLSYIKLLLDSRQEFPHGSRSELEDALQRIGKSAVDVVSDYLTGLYSHAKEEMVKRWGTQMVWTTHIEHIMTVPAVWSDAAKALTLEAAEKAGLGPDLRLVSEPEAAILHALRSGAILEGSLRAGDNYIVVDAGGGTVDLITHEVAELSPLNLSESVPGAGALCGAAFIDMRFKELVKARMGNEVFEQLCRTKRRAWPLALASFRENVKPAYNPSHVSNAYDAKVYYVNFPGAPDSVAAGVEEGLLSLSSAEIGELFRPLICQVIELVKEQKRALAESGKIAKGILLVGGFGKSIHLYNSLTNAFREHDVRPPPYSAETPADLQHPAYRFEVIQPSDAWTALVQGAVLSGIESDLVLNRKARRHYGVHCNSRFDARIHRTEDRYWDRLEGGWRATNQMQWHINRGDTLHSTTTVLFPYYGTSETIIQNGVMETYLICSDAPEAPQRFGPDSPSGPYRLCKLSVDYTKVPKSRWHKLRNSEGKIYFSLCFQLGMQVKSGGIYFDLRIEDKVYGVVKADFV